jgi:hypothetical protein
VPQTDLKECSCRHGTLVIVRCEAMKAFKWTVGSNQEMWNFKSLDANVPVFVPFTDREFFVCYFRLVYRSLISKKRKPILQ